MRPHFRNFALVLMLAASAAWSASARVYVECADGSSCSVPPARPAPRVCCAPAPCDEHPAPAKAPCVLRVKAAPDSVAPHHHADLTQFPPAALLATAIDVAPHDTSFDTVVTDDRHPPPYLSPEQGRGPRAPPARAA